MAYTAKDAIQTFDRYLQNININKVEIEGTKKIKIPAKRRVF